MLHCSKLFFAVINPRKNTINYITLFWNTEPWLLLVISNIQTYTCCLQEAFLKTRDIWDTTPLFLYLAMINIL